MVSIPKFATDGYNGFKSDAYCSRSLTSALTVGLGIYLAGKSRNISQLMQFATTSTGAGVSLLYLVNGATDIYNGKRKEGGVKIAASLVVGGLLSFAGASKFIETREMSQLFKANPDAKKFAYASAAATAGFWALTRGPEAAKGMYDTSAAYLARRSDEKAYTKALELVKQSLTIQDDGSTIDGVKDLSSHTADQIQALAAAFRLVAASQTETGSGFKPTVDATAFAHQDLAKAIDERAGTLKISSWQKLST